MIAMTILSKYEKLTRIYESERSRVYRATKINDGQTVILKVLKNEYPTPDQLRHYRQEHHLTHQLQLAKVIKSLG